MTINEYIEQHCDPDDTDDTLCEVTLGDLRRWNSTWISIDNAMPKPGKAVIVSHVSRHGRRNVITACYFPRMNWEVMSWECDEEEWCDYDEEEDIYYYPEGWYEFGYEMDTYHHISATVTHWIPLPEPPEVKHHE
tara:strand:+ start:1914 stop:2318 length:405 start_codon:yes stop_codon:yes gene_type:complete